MGIELRERSLKEQAAYWDGYNAACGNLKKQMLDKMEHYRELLLAALAVCNGAGFVHTMDTKRRIEEELALNPKWEVLEHMPHMIPMCQDPNAYKAIDEQ